MADDFPREPVPTERANRPAATIAFIVINAVIGVPIIILGGSIGRDYGGVGAAIVILAGCALTAALAMLMAWAGVRTRRSTALLAEQAFGLRGARALNVALGIALLGWFAVEMGFIGQLLADGARLAFGATLPPFIGIAGASLLIGAIAILGIAVIARAPMLFVPLLGLLLCFVALAAFPRLDLANIAAGGAVSPGTGISAIVGSYVVGCVIMPDYSRFIARPRDAVIAAGVALRPVWAIILGCYAVAGLVTGSTEPAAMLLVLGMPALLTLLLPLGLMQNGIMCLYSSALATSTWLRGPRFGTIVIGTMLIGMLLALAGAQSAFVGFLVLLAFVFPPASAILACEALFGTPNNAGVRWRSLAIWSAGSAAAAISQYTSAGLTGVSALDGFIFAFILSFISIRIRKTDVAHAAS